MEVLEGGLEMLGHDSKLLSAHQKESHFLRKDRGVCWFFHVRYYLKIDILLGTSEPKGKPTSWANLKPAANLAAFEAAVLTPTPFRRVTSPSSCRMRSPDAGYLIPAHSQESCDMRFLDTFTLIDFMILF